MSHGFGKVGKRYAKALFEVVDPSELEAMRDSLNTLAEVWFKTPELKIALINPALPISKRQELVNQITGSINSNQKSLSNFVSLLLQNKRTELIPEIACQFSQMFDEYKKALALEITSAFELSIPEKEQYENQIRKSFGSLAKITWQVDTDLIGGMVIRSGDRLIDSSVKGSLDKMATQLLN